MPHYYVEKIRRQTFELGVSLWERVPVGAVLADDKNQALLLAECGYILRDAEIRAGWRLAITTTRTAEGRRAVAAEDARRKEDRAQFYEIMLRIAKRGSRRN